MPFTWLPFGAGPRVCIGERFAMIEMKIAMVKILQKFQLKISEETKQDLLKGDIVTFSYPDIKINICKK